jgi:hypothetical protein
MLLGGAGHRPMSTVGSHMKADGAARRAHGNRVRKRCCWTSATLRERLVDDGSTSCEYRAYRWLGPGEAISRSRQRADRRVNGSTVMLCVNEGTFEQSWRRWSNAGHWRTDRLDSEAERHANQLLPISFLPFSVTPRRPPPNVPLRRPRLLDQRASLRYKKTPYPAEHSIATPPSSFRCRCVNEPRPPVPALVSARVRHLYVTRFRTTPHDNTAENWSARVSCMSCR